MPSRDLDSERNLSGSRDAVDALYVFINFKEFTASIVGLATLLAPASTYVEYVTHVRTLCHSPRGP